MHEQHSVETILHSKMESNGQRKYLIRWTGDYKDSREPIDNVTTDVIDDFNKRKMCERENKHLAKVSVFHISYFLFCFLVSPTHLICFFLVN
jgi:hypothetical protein